MTTPPSDVRERALSLRRWLRVHAVASVTCLWVFITPWFGWPRLPEGELYQPFFALMTIEIPVTVLLYFYLAKLAWERLRDPQLARRSSHLLYGALALQVLGLLALSHVVSIGAAVEAALLLPYGGVAIGLGLWSVDLYLDFFRALGDIEPDAPAR